MSRLATKIWSPVAAGVRQVGLLAGLGSGTPLGGGFTGYDWGGLPFLTEGTFVPSAPQGVTLTRGQSLTVPYVPGYEVGFVTSTGNVWWLA